MQAWLLLLTDSTDNKRMNGHWAVHIVLYLCVPTRLASLALYQSVQSVQSQRAQSTVLRENGVLYR